uniref:KIB1-4 beta-propeller domain-containing protein n=1 Tax=Oryza punctata TaxID=4537 RepID=A0A0E0MA96_ORYPU
MEDKDGESAWTNLPGEIMELIADKASDALTGCALSRSVCQSWRTAVPETPRLMLLPAARGVGDEYALVFPLSRGWSIVVDVRDTSCHLSHLATGATAPLPRLSAVRATAASRVEHLGYEHYAMPDAPGARTHSRNFRVKRRFCMASAGGDRRRRIRIKFLNYYLLFETNLEFSHWLRFAVHVPADTPAASTDGMLIMMYHPVQGKTGMVFWRPGDAAWTKLDNPVDGEDGSSDPLSFVDFAYFDAKMFAMDRNGKTVVIDAATRDYGPADRDADTDSLDYLHLVALPSKLLVVRARVKPSGAESFDVFELGQEQDHDGALEWHEVAGGGDVGGNYDLFLDDHHTTFGGGGGGGGSQIYYVHGGWTRGSRAAAYRYSMWDGEMECVYSSPEDCEEQYSTKPCWFVP